MQFPGTDPFVLSVGGTTIGNISGTSFTEYVWNDTVGIAPRLTRLATGGGISDYFGLPAYQANAGVPKSVNDGHVGRGVPDVAANASLNSGYPLNLGGVPVVMNGTSAAVPLWAGLIAVMNAAVGADLGFVNPILYAIGPAGFRDIVGAPGPASNSLNGAPGYPAGPGWDACTGWGSPNGAQLLQAIKQYIAEQEKAAQAAACANLIPSLEQILVSQAPKFTNAEFARVRALIESCGSDGYLTTAQVTKADGLLAEIESRQHSGGGVPHPR